MLKFLALAIAFMSDTVPTCTIQTKNGPVDINLTDFDPKIHKLVDAKDMPKLKPLDPAQRQSLFGSSVQPASWKLPDGKTLQLNTVVAEAHKRSGQTEESWNALPDGERERMIADVVAEMVPVVPSFTIGKNGKRGGASKFVIHDGAGNVVGEKEYDTHKEAEAEIKILNGEK